MPLLEPLDVEVSGDGIANRAGLQKVTTSAGNVWSLVVLQDNQPIAYAVVTRDLEPPTARELDAVLRENGYFAPRGWSTPQRESERARYRLSARVYTEETFAVEGEQRSRTDAERRWKEQVFGERLWRMILAIVGAGMALMALLDWSSSSTFYDAMRVIVLGVAVALIVLTYRAGGLLWGVPLAAAAILWNPLAPIYMTRSEWLPYDIAAAVLFGLIALWSKGRDPLPRYAPEILRQTP
jgi:hypothetical protein